HATTPGARDMKSVAEAEIRAQRRKGVVRAAGLEIAEQTASRAVPAAVEGIVHSAPDIRVENGVAVELHALNVHAGFDRRFHPDGEDGEQRGRTRYACSEDCGRATESPERPAHDTAASNGVTRDIPTLYTDHRLP